MSGRSKISSNFVGWISNSLLLNTASNRLRPSWASSHPYNLIFFNQTCAQYHLRWCRCGDDPSVAWAQKRERGQHFLKTANTQENVHHKQVVFEYLLNTINQTWEKIENVPEPGFKISISRQLFRVYGLQKNRRSN